MCPRFTRLVKVRADLLGRRSDENLNTKGTLVGTCMDVILDRGSTPLTSIKKKRLLGSLFFFMLLKDRTGLILLSPYTIAGSLATTTR